MGPDTILWHYPSNDIMNGSLLTVESNHFCVLKSRGAILNVYETGQFPVETPQRPLIGSIQQAGNFRNGMPYGRVLFKHSRFGNMNASGLTDAAQIISQQVHNHGQFSLFLGALQQVA